MDPIKLIAEHRKKLEAERGQLRARMAEIDKEIVDQDTALRVFNSLVPSATEDPSDSQAPLPFAPASNGINATPSTVKDLILEILRSASPQGLKAGQIRETAQESYGVDINANTLTVSLGRFKTDGKVRIRMRKWFFVPPTRERHRTPQIEVAGPTSEGGTPATSSSRPALPTGEPHSGHVKPRPGGGT